jgi:hypothetical protein
MVHLTLGIRIDVYSAHSYNDEMKDSKVSMATIIMRTAKGG